MSANEPVNPPGREEIIATGHPVDGIYKRAQKLAQMWFVHNCGSHRICEMDNLVNMLSPSGDCSVWIERGAKGVEVSSNLYGVVRRAEILPGDDVDSAIGEILPPSE